MEKTRRKNKKMIMLLMKDNLQVSRRIMRKPPKGSSLVVDNLMSGHKVIKNLTKRDVPRILFLFGD